MIFEVKRTTCPRCGETTTSIYVYENGTCMFCETDEEYYERNVYEL